MATRSMLDTLAGTSPPTPPKIVENGAFPVVEAPKPIAKGEIRLAPYNAIDDPQADDFLRFMWRRMQREDLVDYYFPGQKDTGFATFVRMMSGDANVMLVLTEAAKDPSTQWKDSVAGFITWSMSHMGSADMVIGGFVFFKDFWDHWTTDKAATEAFKKWFTETPATVILGVCPSLHAVALRYNKRVGLKEVGRLPQAHLFKGQPCDAVLVAITKEEWQAKEGK